MKHPFPKTRTALEKLMQCQATIQARTNATEVDEKERRFAAIGLEFIKNNVRWTFAEEAKRFMDQLTYSSPDIGRIQEFVKLFESGSES